MALTLHVGCLIDLYLVSFWEFWCVFDTEPVLKREIESEFSRPSCFDSITAK